MISKQLLRTKMWIRKMFREEEWMDSEQAYELEIQMLSFYGIEVCNLIDEIELLAHIKHEDLSQYKDNFLQKLKEVEDSFNKDPEKLVLPALKDRFSQGVV